MKFKNPSSNMIQEVATVLGGIVLGSMVSEGVMGVIHKPSGATDAATLKKEKNMGLVKRAAMIAGGGYGAAALSGTDTGSVLVRSAMIGIASKQALEVVRSFAADSPAIKTGASARTATERFIANSVGLGCACNQASVVPSLNAYRPRRRALRMPDMQALDAVPMTDPLQEAINAGAAA